MSCGCQKRTASNGQSACSGCVTSLEAKLNAEKEAVSIAVNTAQPSVAPQRWGRDRYNK
jgi:hypothetical protein